MAATDGIGNGINVGSQERLASLVGGGALVAYGLSRRSPAGWALAALGAGLAYRGATGHCGGYQALGRSTAEDIEHNPNATIGHGQGIKVEKSVTISKPADELYRYWRNFENLPRFMNHLESVTTTGDKRSRWVVKAPAGKSVAWDAEIINEQENEMIAWRSLENADVDNAGSVWFQEAPGGRGTEVKVSLEYRPPAGMVGATLAKLWGEEPSIQVEEDLRRFKRVMETGETPTTEGQPSGRNGT